MNLVRMLRFEKIQLTEEQIAFLNVVCGGIWTLNSKGEVDVDGNVNMNNVNLTEIPVKFGKVGGNFNCLGNNLTTLIDTPTSVGGSFNCSYNPLTSLEGCPSKVGGSFNCSYNQLTSLEFCPSKVSDGFYCFNNQLTNYFKSTKEEDFPHWDKLYWVNILKEYPFLINIGKKYIKDLKKYLNESPLTKLYLE